jgi:hypothetical protein
VRDAEPATQFKAESYALLPLDLGLPRKKVWTGC